MAYCTTDQLAQFGVSSVALAPIPTNVQSAACDAASEVVDSYFRDRYKLPLSAWGVDVTQATAKIAVYDLLVVRGYNPSLGADVNLRLRYTDAIDWLKSVARQEVQANVTPTQDQASGYDDPRVLTNEQRGWTDPNNSGRIFT